MQLYIVYLFLENCSTCFGWYLHPSLGAHTTVFTVSVTCQTVTATCRYCGTGLSVVWELYCFGTVADVSQQPYQVPDTVNTVVCAPDDGWRYHPKHVEQFCRNK